MDDGRRVDDGVLGGNSIDILDFGQFLGNFFGQFLGTFLAFFELRQPVLSTDVGSQMKWKNGLNGPHWPVQPIVPFPVQHPTSPAGIHISFSRMLLG